MVVLSKDVFNGVYIDSILVGPTGCLLRMMVLVNESIDSLDVKRPVQCGVEEIKYDE